MEVKTKFVLVVLLSALVVAFESVAIEGALNIEILNLVLVSAIPSMIGGLILMSVKPQKAVTFAKDLGPRGWLWMIVLCIFVATGVLLWFDAVGRIGAGKEALLGGGSSEVLFVVLLSAIFLSERLSKLEAFGGILIIIGVFLVLTNTDDMSMTLGFGEVEAIVSSFFLGCSIVVTTSLLKEHDLVALSGVELLLSGVFVFVFGVAFDMIAWPDANGWILLVILGFFPSLGLLTYNAGLPKIGASITSVLFALNGILTVGAQLLVLLLFPDADFIPPENLALATMGGAVAFAGVYLLNMSPKAKAPVIQGTKRSAEGEI